MSSGKAGRKFDLEERLIEYVIQISNIVDVMYRTFLGKNIAVQITRSSSSTALNYGEAQGAESSKDFIHKLKIGLKELKESRISLKIAKKKPLVKNTDIIVAALKETEELIAIIYKSIQTSKRNMQN